MCSFSWLEVARACLQAGDRVLVQAHGGSMRPFLRDGDIVEIVPIPAARLRIGDIVAIHRSGQTVLVHRVVHTGDGARHHCIETQGDANGSSDGWVESVQVIGKVITIVRDGKRINLSQGWRRWAGLGWAYSAPLRRYAIPLLRRLWLHWHRGMQ